MAKTTFQLDDEAELFMKKIATFFLTKKDEWLVPYDVVRLSIEYSNKNFDYKEEADVLSILNINRYSLDEKKRYYINFTDDEEAELSKFMDHYKKKGFALYKNQILKMMIFNYYNHLFKS